MILDKMLQQHIDNTVIQQRALYTALILRYLKMTDFILSAALFHFKKEEEHNEAECTRSTTAR